VGDMRVVYSHWHKDHVAGTQSFDDVPVIANARTAQHLADQRATIEAGTKWPPIYPLILPTQTFAGQMTLMLGDLRLDLIEMNIHSDDATVIWLPEAGILLAGDTLEDPITYVSDPGQFATHLVDLARLAALNPTHILPCHGAADIIASGGYGAGLIAATQTYVAFLHALRDHPDRRDTPVFDIIGADIAAGHLQWFDAYAAVHAMNVIAALTGTSDD
jgi:cyclase